MMDIQRFLDFHNLDFFQVGPCEPLFDGLGDPNDSAIVRSHSLICRNHLCGVLLQQAPQNGLKGKDILVLDN